MRWFANRKLQRKLNACTRGREGEKERYRPYVLGEAQQSSMFTLIDATYDLADGRLSPSQLSGIVRQIVADGDSRTWQNATEWLSRTTPDLNEISELWVELAKHPDWQTRWRVACGLYTHGIPEDVSNRLFAILRSDRSNKVRSYAVERYENRPVKDDRYGYQRMEKIFDAGRFDDRVASGEIVL